MEKFVFVVTYGRSGSTILQTILQSIDGYCIKGENDIALLPLFRSVKRIERAQQVYGIEPLATDHPWYGIDQVDPRRYAERIVRVFVDEILRPGKHCRVTGFKEIRYFAAGDQLEEFLDFLREYFHPCQIIFNTRDPDAVSESSWHKRSDRAEVMEMVAQQDRSFREYSDKHPGNCFTVIYDEYTNDPMKLVSLFEFLGEPFDADRVAIVMKNKLTH